MLGKAFPSLQFRHRFKIPKSEINQKLGEINPKLGVTQFVTTSSVKTDGGVIEVKDANGGWRQFL